jgi:hypothetical protein
MKGVRVVSAVISSNVQGIARYETSFWEFISSTSPEYLVERPCITETTFPHFIYHFFGVSVILAERSSAYRYYCSSSNAFLMLLRELPLSSPEEFSRPATFAAEGASANLPRAVVSNQLDLNHGSSMEPKKNTYFSACCMPQITIPVQFKPQVVIGMNHLVRHCIFQMALVTHLVCADLNTIIGIESTSFPLRTSLTSDIVTP